MDLPPTRTGVHWSLPAIEDRAPSTWPSTTRAVWQDRPVTSVTLESVPQRFLEECVGLRHPAQPAAHWYWDPGGGFGGFEPPLLPTTRAIPLIAIRLPTDCWPKGNHSEVYKSRPIPFRHFHALPGEQLLLSVRPSPCPLWDQESPQALTGRLLGWA